VILEFFVTTTSRFDRELKKLAAKHSSLPEVFRQVIEILRADPYNRSRQNPIKKLEGCSAGEAQYRIRSGRFRFRYDVDGQTVILKACSLRRENSYR
jgi:mRNA-degrading endonuclease RelE of RelBE toxin-antitoxin system